MIIKKKKKKKGGGVPLAQVGGRREALCKVFEKKKNAKEIPNFPILFSLFPHYLP